MSCLYAHNLSVSFADGQSLFTGISFSLSKPITALIGDNGSGKSLLAKFLAGKDPGTDCSVGGSVSVSEPVCYLPQINEDMLHSSSCSIADYLGYSAKIEALARIASGSVKEEDFELVGNDWLIEEQLKSQLKQLCLPENYALPCSCLSGGQLARLQLFRIFRDAEGLLILDEPSNHLDAAGKQWLLEQMVSFAGHILIVSHDRELLTHVDEIMVLGNGNLSVYGGNYKTYAEQFAFEQAAKVRQLEHAVKSEKKLVRNHQDNESKAATRIKQGRKLSLSGSQSPILMGAMKRAAQGSAGARKAKFEKKRNEIQDKISDLKAKLPEDAQLKLTLGKVEKRINRILDINGLELPFPPATDSKAKISFSLDYGDKLHLKGPNGCGKSSLLKTIAGIHQQYSGEIICRDRVCYLDQHFSLLSHQDSALDNLLRLCPKQSKTDLRTLLAGIGLKGERAFQSLNTLSGGEKMKVAMLAVSHQGSDSLLLLDEPDNHLDMKSKKHLSGLLSAYPGPFILVSHDSFFVDDSGITKELCLT
ncbi:ATP-binding cassette domain-containing protein [Parasalinivibrio latis]|uniref:ATP-binding cassette domain-containing protein n=1 Tax=Parasalinivibrio latis TaxID=2952610 RepID=UPI0030E10F73